MTNKYIPNLTYNEKEYYIGVKPIQQINLLLAQDWNKFEIIDTCISAVNDLSSTIYEVVGRLTFIDDYLIDRTDNYYPSTSFLLTINGLTGDLTGISTIRINGTDLYGPIDAWYLSAGINLVSSFNRKSGQLECVSSIILSSTGIDTPQLTADISNSLTADLGNYFKQNEVCVSSINDYNNGGDYHNVSLLSALKINNSRAYTSPQMKYVISVDEEWKKDTFDRIANYDKAVVSSSTKFNGIVNVDMCSTHIQLSAIVEANTPKTLNNVVDWICITDKNYSIIKPTTATLVNGTLTITSPSDGIIYFYSKIAT